MSAPAWSTILFGFASNLIIISYKLIINVSSCLQEYIQIYKTKVILRSSFSQTLFEDQFTRDFFKSCEISVYFMFHLYLAMVSKTCSAPLDGIILSKDYKNTKCLISWGQSYNFLHLRANLKTHPKA